MSIGNMLLNGIYGNPLSKLSGGVGGPGALPGNQGSQGQPAGPQQAPVASGTPSAAPSSPPDLANLYLQLAQRQQQARGIDQGLALMAAANSTPSMQRAIMGSVGQGQQGGFGPGNIGDMIALMNTQRLMNMPNPSGGGGVAPGGGALAPGGGGVNQAPAIPDEIWRNATPDMRQKLMEQYATTQLGTQTKLTEAKQADLLEAQQKAPGAIDQFSRADNLSNQIMNATEADGSSVMKNITGSALKRNAAQAMIDAQTSEPGKEKGSWTETAAYYLAHLTDAEKAAINNAIQLNGMVYGEQFANAGSRRTQAEIKGLQSGASQLLAFNQPYDNYQKQFGDFQNKLHTSIANAYGEAGQIDQIPEQYRWDQNGNPLVNSEYRPGGPLYVAGGDWLKNPPTQVAQGGGQGPVKITGPGDIAKLPRGTPFVIPSGPSQGKIGYAQ